MAKKKRKQSRSMSEKIWIVVAVILALSMIIPSIASLFGAGGGHGF